MKKKNKLKFWSILFKVILFLLLFVVGAFSIWVMFAAAEHKKLLAKEEQYMTPPGQMVQIEGNDIHVMRQGAEDGTHTIVYLHSNKTVDDSIAVQPLFDELQDNELIYVDRSGYGFSGYKDTSKDITSILEETRQAVKAVSKNDKYVLMASKTGGIIAFYWAITYPEEVEAVIGLEMYLPEQYIELPDDEYVKFYDKLAIKLVSWGAHRKAAGSTPVDDFGIYTDLQMKTRAAIIAKSLYTEGMYEEDGMLVKNAKSVYEMGWPEDVPMYLIYGNPFMEPYLHLSDESMQIEAEVSAQGEEYDCEEAYNYYYRDVLASHKNVVMEELSGPERIIIFQPDVLAEKVQNYLKKLNENKN